MAARCLLFDGEHLLPPSGVNFTDKIICVICGSVASIWPGGTIMAANKNGLFRYWTQTRPLSNQIKVNDDLGLTRRCDSLGAPNHLGESFRENELHSLSSRSVPFPASRD
jgi:hypothetical protein